MQMRMPLFILTILVFFTPIDLGFADSSSKDKDEGMVFSNHELSRWEGNSIKLAERYENNIRNIRLGKVHLENKIMELRSYYPHTRYYDPFSKELMDEMTLYAYTVDTSDDRVEVNRALDSFREFVYKHLAHLDVVSYAYTLSRLDPRLGDETFFKKVRDLIRGSWDGMPRAGSTPDYSYNVITYAEENYILETYGATVEKSEIYEVSGQFFDVRDIVTEDGNNLQLFFNVTTPIRTVNILKGLIEREAEAFIPLQ